MDDSNLVPISYAKMNVDNLVLILCYVNMDDGN